MDAIRFTYNEDSNVFMTASQMSGSDIFQDKQVFPRYMSMGLSRNSTCLKTYNEQKQREQWE